MLTCPPRLNASRLTLVNRKTSQRIYAGLRKRVEKIAKAKAKPPLSRRGRDR